eukprot:scaffold1350_cov137-Skeletonema_dohrnii-CCMP3373.AAC.1
MDEQPIAEVTITADAAAASAAIGNDDSSHDDHQQSKELAIQTLLEIIDSNDIQIDDQLRRAILGQETFETPFIPDGDVDDGNDTLQQRSTRPTERHLGRTGSSIRRTPSLSRRSLLTKRESIWGFFVRKHSTELAEVSAIEKEIICEMKEKFGETWFDNMSFECRVMDGSYSVE